MELVNFHSSALPPAPLLPRCSLARNASRARNAGPDRDIVDFRVWLFGGSEETEREGRKRNSSLRERLIFRPLRILRQSDPQTKQSCWLPGDVRDLKCISPKSGRSNWFAMFPRCLLIYRVSSLRVKRVTQAPTVSCS